VKITFGTGAFALGLMGEKPPSAVSSGLIPTCAWQLGSHRPEYALDGGILTAGAALEWLRNIGLIASFEELDDFEGPPAAMRGTFFVPAHAGLGCPHWDHSARSLWIGMDLATSRADLCRAVVEGIAFRAAELVAAFGAVTPCTRIAIDGGLTRSFYFCQFLANAIGEEIHVAQTAEVSAMGLLQLAQREVVPEMPAAIPSFRRIAPTENIADQVRERFAHALRQSRGWSSS
jgi:glycerol kinase